MTLIDRRNHHLFQPLLYQVATAALNPSDIASPIRRILRDQKNAEVLLAEATIDRPGREDGHPGQGVDPLRLPDRGDGARHSYFGHDEWTPHAPGLKSIGDALEIRRRVLSAFEEAEREPDPAKRHAWLTFVIVGGGPTGVELAGALCEIARHALAHDFRQIDPTQARVILLEGSARVLPPYAPDLSEKARQQLVAAGRRRPDGQGRDGDRRRGGQHRRRADRDAHRALGGGRGGLAARPGAGRAARPRRAGPGRARPDHPRPSRGLRHRRPGQPGRSTASRSPASPRPRSRRPGTPRRTSLRALRGEPALPFHYQDKGSLATIGRSAAVADLGRIKLSGLLAWLAWLFIHILFLIGFRNRFLVLFQWAWSFVTYDRGARLITGPFYRAADQARA